MNDENPTAMKMKKASVRDPEANRTIEEARMHLAERSTVALVMHVGDALPTDPLVHARERERAERFRFRSDANLHLAGRHLVRSIIGLRRPVAPFPVTKRGRPERFGGPVFSISHSGDWIAVVLSPECPVGIDVEARLRGDLGNLVPRVCHRNEAAWLDGQPVFDEALLRIWTRKEAVLKALGVGILDDLTVLDTQPEHDNGPELDLENLRVWSIPIPEGALSISARGRVVLCRPGVQTVIIE